MQKLKYYKKIKEEAGENYYEDTPYKVGLFLIGYNSVDSYLQNPTDEEFETIVNECFNAYMDDDYDMSFSSYVDIVAEIYANGLLGLDELKGLSARELNELVFDQTC